MALKSCFCRGMSCRRALATVSGPGCSRPFLSMRTHQQTSNINISWGWRWRAASEEGCLAAERSLQSADPAAPACSCACALINRHPILTLAEGGAEKQLQKRDVSPPSARYGQRTRPLPPVLAHARLSTVYNIRAVKRSNSPKGGKIVVICGIIGLFPKNKPSPVAEMSM